MKTLSIFILLLFSGLALANPIYDSLTDRTLCSISKITGGNCSKITDFERNLSNLRYNVVLKGQNPSALSEIELFKGALAVCTQFNADLTGRGCNPSDEDVFFCAGALSEEVFTTIDYNNEIYPLFSDFNPDTLRNIGRSCD